MGYWNPKTDLESMMNMYKLGLREIHSETDKVFIDKFLRGGISQKTYANFLAQLYFVYEALEEEMDKNKDNYAVGPIHFPHEMTRMPGIQEDLEFLYGSDWFQQITQLESTKQYVARLRYVGEHTPHLLHAHAFTRYMGDLFGGQILKRKWRKVFNLKSDKGTRFYMFDHVDHVPTFRALLESRTNGIDQKLEAKQEQVEEAKKAFIFNTDMIEEILDVARNTPGGFLEVNPDAGKTWEEEMKQLSDNGKTGTCAFAPKSGNGQSCPFHKATKYTSYGLLACATVAVAYPLVKRALYT